MKQTIIALLRNAPNLSLGLIWLRDFPAKFQICAARYNAVTFASQATLWPAFSSGPMSAGGASSVLGPQSQASHSRGITTSYQSQLSARDCIHTSELLGLYVFTWEMRSENKGGTKAIFLGWPPCWHHLFPAVAGDCWSSFQPGTRIEECLHGALLLLFSVSGAQLVL